MLLCGPSRSFQSMIKSLPVFIIQLQNKSYEQKLSVFCKGILTSKTLANVYAAPELTYPCFFCGWVERGSIAEQTFPAAHSLTVYYKLVPTKQLFLSSDSPICQSLNNPPHLKYQLSERLPKRSLTFHPSREMI